MAEAVTTNLRVLQPSRKRLRAGDVFVMQMPDERYLFGRVISTEAISGLGVPGAILIYIYRARSPAKDPPDRSTLIPDNLLVPPIMINRLPWSRGYFETIVHWPLEPEDVLPQHCFSDASVTGKYFDERGNELPGPVEPCGHWGLASFRVVDDEVSDALGFPLVPD